MEFLASIRNWLTSAKFQKIPDCDEEEYDGICSLPVDIFLHTLRYLSIWDVANLRISCRNLYHKLGDDKIWQEFYLEHFPNNSYNLENNNTEITILDDSNWFTKFRKSWTNSISNFQGYTSNPEWKNFNARIG
jgi:hypothetical protein